MQNAFIYKKNPSFLKKFKILVELSHRSCRVTQSVTRSDLCHVLWVEREWPGPPILLPVSSPACGFVAQDSLASGKPNPLAACLFLPQESSPWQGGVGSEPPRSPGIRRQSWAATYMYGSAHCPPIPHDFYLLLSMPGDIWSYFASSWSYVLVI